MKKLLIVILLMIGVNSCSGKKTKEKTSKNIEVKIEEKNQGYEYSADIAKLDEKTNIMELSGNVSFESDLLKIEKADKLLLNKENNEIRVSGLSKFSFNGEIQISSKKIIKYKFGERIVHVE